MSFLFCRDDWIRPSSSNRWFRKHNYPTYLRGTWTVSNSRIVTLIENEEELEMQRVMVLLSPKMFISLSRLKADVLWSWLKKLMHKAKTLPRLSVLRLWAWCPFALVIWSYDCILAAERVNVFQMGKRRQTQKTVRTVQSVLRTCDAVGDFVRQHFKRDLDLSV